MGNGPGREPRKEFPVLFGQGNPPDKNAHVFVRLCVLLSFLRTQHTIVGTVPVRGWPPAWSPSTFSSLVYMLHDWTLLPTPTRALLQPFRHVFEMRTAQTRAQATLLEGQKGSKMGPKRPQNAPLTTILDGPGLLLGERMFHRCWAQPAKQGQKG